MSVVAAVESDFSLRKLRIAGICLIGQLFGGSMLLIGPLSMVMIDMNKEFGWTRSQFSGSTTFVMLAGALASPFIGRLIDRVGVRPVVLIGTVAVGLLSLALAHQTSSLWLFFLIYALVGIFGANVIGYGKIMGSLFTRHRGKAMAFVAAFSPLIASVFPQFSIQLLLAYGWRGVFTGYGITILLSSVPLYFFLEEPARTFTTPAEGDAHRSIPAPPEMEGLTVSEAFRGRTLWILIGGGMVGGILGAGWVQHSFAFHLSRDFSPQAATNALTISLLIAPVAIMFGGWLVDKVQTAKIYAPFALIAALSIYLQSIVWSNFGGMPLLYVAVTLSTVAVNVQMPMLGYFYTRFFGMKAFASIAGINMAALSLVSAFSAVLVGVLFEHKGSYDLAMTGMIAGYVLSSVLYLFIGRYRYTVDFKPIPLSKPNIKTEQAIGQAIS